MHIKSQLGPLLLIAGPTLVLVSCGGDDVAAPGTGSIEVAVATGGPEPDPDGYTLSVDGGAEVSIGVNATHRRDNLEPGSYSVRLGGMAANCAVQGDNPRAVDVAAGASAAVDFTVSCGSTGGGAVGALEITTTTTGTPPDPDGYTVAVDNGAAQPIGVSATLRVPGLSPGPHQVTLAGVATNCRVDGENLRAVTVNAGATAQESFSVTCSSAPQSSSKIAFLSTRDPGENPDIDLYVMNPDGTDLQRLTVGSDVLKFDWSPDGRRIVFDSDDDQDIFMINVDGTGLVNLTNTPGIREGEPDWSPDGGRIAFLQDEGIHVMNPDGSGGRRVVDGAFLWEWSPDGGKLAFLGRDDLGRERDYYVINVDGSGETNLTNTPQDGKQDAPYWSPDGQTIAFTASPPNVFTNEIYLINPDGSNQRRLTNNEANDDAPLWSPSGQRIAFNTDRDRGQMHDSREIYLMNPDGSAQTNVTNTPGGTEPHLEDELLRGWSPDGSKILYARVGEIWVMNADGSGQTNLNQRGHDSAWSPQ